MYSLSIQEPTVTIVLFSALALVLYLISLRVAADYERIAIAAARTCLVLVNFGFWIGSLWGDRLRLYRYLDRRTTSPAGRNSPPAARSFRTMCSRSAGRWR